MICPYCEEPTEAGETYHQRCFEDFEAFCVELNHSMAGQFARPVNLEAALYEYLAETPLPWLEQLNICLMTLPAWAAEYFTCFQVIYPEEKGVPEVDFRSEKEVNHGLLLQWAESCGITENCLREYLPDAPLTQLCNYTDALIGEQLMESILAELEMKEVQQRLQNGLRNALVPYSEREGRMQEIIEQVRTAPELVREPGAIQRLEKFKRRIDQVFRMNHPSLMPQQVRAILKKLNGQEFLEKRQADEERTAQYRAAVQEGAGDEEEHEATDRQEEVPKAQEELKSQKEQTAPKDQEQQLDESDSSEDQSIEDWDSDDFDELEEWDGPFDLEEGETPLFDTSAVIVDLDRVAQFLKGSELELPEEKMREALEPIFLESQLLDEDDLEEVFLESDIYLTNRRIFIEEDDTEILLAQVQSVTKRVDGLLLQVTGLSPKKWVIVPYLEQSKKQFVKHLLGLIEETP